MTLLQLESLSRPMRGLAAAVALAACWGGPVRAATYYWDANGVAAGAGFAPGGTWDNTVPADSFFNTDATGGNGTSSGTFTDQTTATDTVQFVAGPTLTAAGDTGPSGSGTYAVTVDGTQSAAGLVVRQSGALTFNGGTLVIGTGGIDFGARYVTGNAGGVPDGGLIINSNIVVAGNQAWPVDNINLNGLSYAINGNTTGSGNLTLSDNSNRPYAITGSLNPTGGLTANPTNVNAIMTVSGAIGSNVSGLTVGAVASSGVADLKSASGNSYMGATTVLSGTLRLDNTSGSGTGAGAVGVSGSAAAISGTGISTGMLTVTGGGIIAPGDNVADGANTINSQENFGAAGTLTLGNASLTNAVLDLDLDTSAAGANNDKVVFGALTLGGTLTFNLRNTVYTAAGGTLQTGVPYTLFTFTNALTSLPAIMTNFQGVYLSGNYTASYTLVGNSLEVTFTAVPEPSVMACALAGSVIVATGISFRRARSGAP